MKTKARGQNLIFADTESGEILCDTDQLWQRAENEKQRARHEAELRKQETARAEMEKQRAEILTAKLRELGITPDMNA